MSLLIAMAIGFALLGEIVLAVFLAAMTVWAVTQEKMLLKHWAGLFFWNGLLLGMMSLDLVKIIIPLFSQLNNYQ